MPIRPENRHRYPSNWPAISREIRFTRAAGRCECLGECGRGTHTGRCPNVHGRPAYGTGSNVVLTTAHLDHTPENCEPENLRAMCNGCHLHYDRHHHAQTAAATRRAAVEAAGQLALATTEETTVTTTHTPRRIQRKRTPGWTLAGATDNPSGAVIVSRPSRFGNPFTVRDAIEAEWSNPRRAVTANFAEWLRVGAEGGWYDETYRIGRQVLDRRRILAELHTLRGRDLACTCPLPEPGQPDHCHGAVLLALAAAATPGTDNGGAA